MKPVKRTIILFLCLLCMACNRHKNDFVLEGTVAQGVGDTILVSGFDSRFARIDTIISKNGNLKWSFRPDTATTVILCMSDGRTHPVMAGKGEKAIIDIPLAGTGEISVSGSEYNRILQEFRRNSASDKFKFQTLERLDSLITTDPFSPVLPYLIYEYGVCKYHATAQELNKLIQRMSGSMQDDPFLSDLKSRFPKTDRRTLYLTDLTMLDTARTEVPFSNYYKGTYKLVCVWASYDGQSVEGRNGMKKYIEKYSEDEIAFMDISIDTNIERWFRTLEESDSIDMESFCDTKGWNSTLIESANTSKLPVFLLVSPQNRVVKGYRNDVQIYHAVDSVLEEVAIANRNRKPEKKTDKNKKTAPGKSPGNTNKKPEPRKLIF